MAVCQQLKYKGRLPLSIPSDSVSLSFLPFNVSSAVPHPDPFNQVPDLVISSPSIVSQLNADIFIAFATINMHFTSTLVVATLLAFVSAAPLNVNE